MLADFTVQDAQYGMDSFTKIDNYTYAIDVPSKFYGNQEITLNVDVASKDQNSKILDYQILTTDKLDQNPDAQKQTQSMVECPAIIEMTAATIYNMTCFINNVDVADLTLLSQATGAAKFSSQIKALSTSFV